MAGPVTEVCRPRTHSESSCSSWCVGSVRLHAATREQRVTSLNLRAPPRSIQIRAVRLCAALTLCMAPCLPLALPRVRLQVRIWYHILRMGPGTVSAGNSRSVLAGIGRPAVPALVVALDAPRIWPFLWTSTYAEGALMTMDAPDALVPYLSHHSTNARSCAIGILRLSGPRGVRPALIPLLDDPVLRVRFAAAYALASWGDSSGGDVLLEALAHHGHELRAAWALGQTKLRKAVRPLRAKLHTQPPDKRLGRIALHSLCEITGGPYRLPARVCTQEELRAAIDVWETWYRQTRQADMMGRDS